MAEVAQSVKVVIVTGAGSGIGREVARAFVSQGYRVALFDIHQAGLDSLAEEFDTADHAGRYIQGITDISDPAACEAAVARTVEELGGLHVLINNAALGMGIIRMDHMTNLVKIHEIEPAVWRQFMDVNLCGPWYMTRFAAPHMLGQGWGRIISITTSFFTMLRGGFHPYGPAKAGVESMASGLAQEFAGSGVNVHVVVPGGPTDTPMVPDDAPFVRADLIRPAKMAEPMLWLCSHEADEVNGRRYVAAQWDSSLAPAEAARRCGTAIAWPDLAQSPVWPGGKPEE